MDEIFELVEGYEVSEMSDEHTTAVITEKDVDISNIGTIVMGEENSSIITFKMNRYYDGVDLSEKKIKVMFRNSAMEMFRSEVCNVRKSKNTIKFSWIIPNDVTKNNKIVAYICFISENYLLKTKNFNLTLEKSFDPGNTEPTQNWFVTIEGKLDKIEKQLADNIIYDWAKQPKKPTYTPEEIGAEKAGAADGILNNAIKYTDGEISRLEDTVIQTKIAELNGKKAEKVHSHLVSDITDFPTSLPASDVPEWAKARTKPSYTYSEVGALADTTHIPSKLEEMMSDDSHMTVSKTEKEKWDAKSEFSGNYSDLTDIPEIKQLTDELKKKYDDASNLSKTNEFNITKKLNKSGYTPGKWLQTDNSGNIIIGEKPTYTATEIGAATSDHNHDSAYASKKTEHIHENKDVLDKIDSSLVDSWNKKSTLSASVTEDGILKFAI
ncbi:hypothetical protein ACQRDF_02575 [Lachnospiraceae bacterium SGI.054]